MIPVKCVNVSGADLKYQNDKKKSCIHFVLSALQLNSGRRQLFVRGGELQLVSCQNEDLITSVRLPLSFSRFSNSNLSKGVNSTPF